MITISSVIAFTDVGKVRSENQDTVYCDPQQRFWVLADGMGGHSGGKLASEEVVRVVAESLPGSTIQQSINKAQRNLSEIQEQNSELKNMGSTIALAEINQRGFNIAWMGDSRIYHYDGTLRRLSHDHSFVQELIDRGLYTAEQARQHDKKNLITRYLGSKDAQHEPAISTISPTRSGSLMLCCDGVTDHLSDQEIGAIFTEFSADEDRASALREALFNTVADDNISFIIVSYDISWRLKIINSTFFSS